MIINPESRSHHRHEAEQIDGVLYTDFYACHDTNHMYSNSDLYHDSALICKACHLRLSFSSNPLK